MFVAESVFSSDISDTHGVKGWEFQDLKKHKHFFGGWTDESSEDAKTLKVSGAIVKYFPSQIVESG